MAASATGSAPGPQDWPDLFAAESRALELCLRMLLSLFATHATAPNDNDSTTKCKTGAADRLGTAPHTLVWRLQTLAARVLHEYARSMATYVDRQAKLSSSSSSEVNWFHCMDTVVCALLDGFSSSGLARAGKVAGILCVPLPALATDDAAAAAV